MTTKGSINAPIATSDSEQRWRRFCRCWAVAALSLIAATWQLWWSTGEFPQVPMFNLPLWWTRFDAVVIASMMLCLFWIAVRAPRGACVYWWFVASLGLAFLSNQHRLQPWAYQAALHGIALAALSPQSARRWLAAITISIYFYSACGKLDYQFLHTVGQQFVALALGPSEGVPSRGRLLLAACLPLAELSVAVALCVPRLRRVAGVTAMLMHAALLAVLGPWMLGHSTGVLLWNAWLIPLAWFLFVASPRQLGHSPPQRRQAWMARVALLAALLLPLLERRGHWDHWLSWSLYSPHTSRVEIELHEMNLVALPKSALPFVVRDEFEDQWHGIALDRWSLETLGVPLYPQARFQLGVADSIAAELPFPEGIRVKVKSASDRWDGSRTQRWLRGRSEIKSMASEYWLMRR